MKASKFSQARFLEELLKLKRTVSSLRPPRRKGRPKKITGNFLENTFADIMRENVKPPLKVLRRGYVWNPDTGKYHGEFDVIVYDSRRPDSSQYGVLVRGEAARALVEVRTDAPVSIPRMQEITKRLVAARNQLAPKAKLFILQGRVAEKQNKNHAKPAMLFGLALGRSWGKKCKLWEGELESFLREIRSMR